VAKEKAMIQATETLIDLTLLAQCFGVSVDALQTWLAAGLECEHWNGRTLTSRAALLRFQQRQELSARLHEQRAYQH
jgi:hypothetical protein